ncbi:hypothetical protein [Nocardioides sp. Arc9.136]|uniref:hypothetical protein n=1 Tax=Nocardioides sp. Arc9.136 TaxID=2996826 RepID=UPI0026671E49|nr:hypothetical protein [Nocardioides sp. Arc9.136]WKN47170.1 hypothetical protein OSR43_14090 [Nocardioides sp. Arc9.136]
MKILAAHRPANDTTAEAQRFTIEVPEYDDAAMDQVRARIPEGHLLLHVQTAD